MDFMSLDPSRAYCDTCQIYLTAVYETLIGLAPDNKTLEPRLALSWEGNGDQTQFTFKLDPKAKFADGTQVTSADVKFSWERLGGLKGSASYLVGQIKSIDTPDPETVVANMTTSNSAFLAQVNAAIRIINTRSRKRRRNATRHRQAEPGSLPTPPAAARSPGSYTQARERSSATTLLGGKPAFPEVVIKETPTALTQRQQLEADGRPGHADLHRRGQGHEERRGHCREDIAFNTCTSR